MSFDGFINLNKEVGGSSQNMVSAIKHLLGTKAGHCGTLDPQAGGVLPICLGKATRLSDFVMIGEKTYLGRICFGKGTDSYDTAGEVVAEADASALTREQVEQEIPRFVGEIDQVAPVISALKQGGQPLYKRARRGEEIQAPCRRVTVHNISLLDFQPGALAYAEIRVDCGHGVYIRSLAHDLGEALGYPAHLCALTREHCGNFDIADAYSLEQLREMATAGDYSFIRPMEGEIRHVPAVTVEQNQLMAVSHGNPVPYRGELALDTRVQLTDENGKLLALGSIIDNGKYRQVKVGKVFIETIHDLACAIGNFDGLHRGHRALFAALAEQKRQRGCKTAVLTFDPHPLELIRGEAPQLLTGGELKNQMLTEFYGVDRVIVLPFDREMMNSTPQEFVQKVLCDRVQVNSLVVGYNFTFASKGQGNSLLLQQLCAEKNIPVTIVDEVSSELGRVSSTHIRQLLAEGDLDAVNRLLGYWFVMQGTVIHGNQIGRTIGFPTANFRPAADQALPPKGVYAVRIQALGNTYDGVANFGYKPTIGGEKEPLLEANLFDTQLDLYDKEIRVWFGHFLRPEQKFAGLPELLQQIRRDSQEAREYLSQIPAKEHLPKALK